MKTKLIKLQDKFILVSDEVIKEGDSIYSFKSKNVFKADSIEYMEKHNMIEDFDKSFYINSNQSKKIIAGIPELPSIDFSLLSEEDSKTIGWVDVEKLSYKLFPYMEGSCDGNDIDMNFGFRNGFIEGFKAAQSLNDKMFSLDNVVSILDDIQKDLADYQNEIGIGMMDDVQWQQMFVDRVLASITSYEQLSLQQTSWDVEVNEFNQITKIL